MKLKLAYFGSPNFSADFLEKVLIDKDLKEIISIEFVVTQPDKPATRKQILTPTPVKQLAKKYLLKVIELENLKDENLLKIKNWQQKIKGLNLVFVYAYSSIIPKKFLNLPTLGFWCLHPSLLPKYRGPSPVIFTLLNGEKEGGITIFKMDEKIDSGPIIAQKSLTIKKDDYRIDLETKLTQLGFETFKEIVIKKLTTLLANNKILNLKSNHFLTLKPQKENLAVYTRPLKKEDGFINYQTIKKILKNQKVNFDELPKIIQETYLNKKNFNFSLLIFNFFKGLHPWPGVWTILPNGKRLKILSLIINPSQNLVIKEVQLEGKKPVDFKTFTQAYNVF